MGAVQEEVQYIEVISKFMIDGTLIPIKIKVQDEDGEYQSFMVKGFKRIVCNAAHRCFDCKIEVFDHEQIVRIFYNSTDYKWRILKKAD